VSQSSWKMTINTAIPPKNTVFSYFLSFREFKTADNARNTLNKQLDDKIARVTLTDDNGKSIQFLTGLYLGCTIEEIQLDEEPATGIY
jgi:hypothetical protein